MKVFVKTLKETYLEIDVNLKDKVADVKKHLESLGSDVYQAALHMLIHNGKVLQDGTTLQQNKVSENSFMVIKNKSFSATQVAPPPGPQPPSSTTNSPSNNPYNQAPPQPPVNPPQPPQPAAPPTGPNANPWNPFPERVPAGDVDGFLDSMLSDPGFHAFRSKMQANPQELRPLYQDLRRQYPQPHMRRLINDYIMRMINDPFAEVGDGRGQRASGVSESLVITVEDVDALDRLEAMGFDSSVVWNVYFDCDKNEELAANYLKSFHA